MILAEKISTLRKKSGWSQEELAMQLNVSRQSVSKWESASSVPDLDKILQLSQLFGVTVDYLLHEHAEEKSQKIPPRRINHRTVALISFIGVWTAALFVFIVFYLLGQIQWLSFVYALPVSLTVLLVMKSVWGKRKANLYIISALNWSLLATVYLSVWRRNWWILFLLGIPAQIITCLSFRIRPKPQRKKE